MSLGSPYIIKCYGSQTDGNRIRIELEYAQNGSLKTQITVFTRFCFNFNGSFSCIGEESVRSLFRRLYLENSTSILHWALWYSLLIFFLLYLFAHFEIHRHHIVHHDIKPENILLDESDQLYFFPNSFSYYFLPVSKSLTLVFPLGFVAIS